MKEILILFLEWMNEKTQEAPMSLETDNEDIVLMFLESYKQRTGHELIATTMDEMRKICNQEFESGVNYQKA